MSRIRQFQKLGYKVDIFLEFFFISGILAAKEDISFEHIATFVLELYEVKSQDKEEFLEIYRYYYTLVVNFYLHILDDDRYNEPESALMERIDSLSSALFHQLPMTLLPKALYESIEEIIPTLYIVFEFYDVDMQAKDFLQQVEKKMGPFVHEKVEHFFTVITQLEKESKKFKRVNEEMIQKAKFVIIYFIFVCWDIRFRHKKG